MRRAALRSALALAEALSLPVLATAQTPVYLLGRVDSGGAGSTNFGGRVSVSGDIAAVSQTVSSRIHLYGRNVEGPEAWGKILHLDRNTAHGDHFGVGLDLEGDRLAVGAPESREVLFDAGAAWIFERNAGGPDDWGEVRQIAPDDLVALDHFGNAVDLDGDRLLVGSHLDNHHNLDDPGSAYVFERDAGGADNWGQVAHLIPEDPEAGAWCGHEVALDGDVAAIACYWSDTVYVFERDAGGTGNWGQVAKLVGPVPGDDFGQTIAVLGDVLAVGAPGDDEAAEDAGAVYHYTRSSVPPFWSTPEKLILADVLGGEEFGYVAITADWLLVGAPGDSSLRPNSGAAYLYAPDPGEPLPWMLAAKIQPFDRHVDDRFGFTALDGDLAMIAAPRWVGPSNHRIGAVYYYCLGCSTILADGFESGDTRRWSRITP